MNKNLIIGGVVIAVVVVGGGFMMMNSKDKDQNNSSSTSQTSSSQKSTTNESPATETTNAEKLAKSGKPQHCTFEYTTDGSSATGNIFTDGKGKSRMTIEGIKSTQSTSATNNMIIVDSKYYSWITTGSQMIGFSGDLGSQTPTSSTNTTSPNKDYSVKCVNWTVDNAKFQVPTDVKFTNLNLASPSN